MGTVERSYVLGPRQDLLAFAERGARLTAIRLLGERDASTTDGLREITDDAIALDSPRRPLPCQVSWAARTEPPTRGW